jgi:hypothetical protein
VWLAGHTEITPHLLQTQVFHTPSYTETDLTGGGFARTFADKSATATRSELGARFDSLMLLGGKALALRARLAWAHDWVSTPALSGGIPGAAGPKLHYQRRGAIGRFPPRLRGRRARPHAGLVAQRQIRRRACARRADLCGNRDGPVSVVIASTPGEES